MKLKFKKQVHQTRAVEAVVDCFKGQPNTAGISYRIDPGVRKNNADGAAAGSAAEVNTMATG